MTTSKTWVEYEVADSVRRDRVKITRVSKVQGYPKVEVWYWCDETRSPRVGDVVTIYHDHRDGKNYVIAPYACAGK